MSEVSSSWFDTIGGSRKCMKEVRLGLDNWWQTETPDEMSRVMEIIRNTTRKYQYVHINCNDNVQVSQNALSLLETLAPWVVDLRFINADGINEIHPMEFPMLEKLQFINNVSQIDDLLLQGTSRLKELNMKHHYWAEVAPVVKCLKANKDITLLKLWDTGIGKLFEVYEPDSFKFKLKRFATGSDGVMSLEVEDNFLDFLDSQSDSLEAIRFRSGLGGVNAQIISKVFEMSAIKIIHLDGIEKPIDIELQVNPGIIELRLPWKIDNAEKLLPFLKAAPNLEVLYLKKLNRWTAAVIADTLKNLRILNYDRAEGCLRCLTNSLSPTDAINKDLKLKRREWF